MKKLLFRTELSGAIFVIIIGTLLHFGYEFSGNSVIVGIFTPINESVWEHTKLAFFPLLLFGILEYFLFRGKIKNFFYVKACEFYLVVFLIISIFYTYSGIIGRNFLIVDILIFVVAVIIGKILSYELFLKGERERKSAIIPTILLIILTIAFIAFTFSPPHIQLFKDPVTNTYGIYKNP